MITGDLLFHNTTTTAAITAEAVTTAATTIISPLIATTTATLINGFMNSNFVGLNLNDNFTNSVIQLKNDSQTIIYNNSSVSTLGGDGYNGGIIDDNKDLYEYYSQLPLCEVKNIYFNCTVEEYLKYVRGPQTLPLSTALSVTIFFLGIFITGILGNVLVCVVIIRNSGMHTATNYYLFSLAVSDLIFLLWGLPYEISLYWHQYPYNLGLGFCKIRALISEASTYVSVLTIVAFSMERFLAICHPLHLYTMSGFKRAVRIIAVLWVVSFLSAVPFGVYTKIDYIVYPLDNSTIQDSAFCAMLENPNGFPLWELSSLIFFAIPMVIIIILYGRMGLRIRNRTQHSAALGVQHGSVHGESRQSQSRRAIIRMLAAVVITFFVCWAPFHAQRLMFLYAHKWEHYQDLNDWLFSVTGWLYYVSCTINPILYNIMSQRYRVAFRETLCGTKRAYYRNNGFCREQSSFRETTITVSSNTGYETSQLPGKKITLKESLKTSTSGESTSPKKKIRRKLKLKLLRSAYRDMKLNRNRLDQQIVRRNRKIANLKTALEGLRDKNLIQEEHMANLLAISQPTKELLKRQLRKFKDLAVPKKYPSEIRNFAMNLNFYSPKGYEYVRKVFNLQMLNVKTIAEWYKCVDGKAGFPNESFHTLRVLVNNELANNQDVFCNIFFDEINIRSQVEWNGKRSVGCVDIGNGDENEEVATQILVFMVVWLNKRWKLRLRFFPIAALNSEQKTNLLHMCLNNLFGTGVQAIGVTFNGCPVNFSVGNLLGCKTNLIKNFNFNSLDPKLIFN